MLACVSVEPSPALTGPGYFVARPIVQAGTFHLTASPVFPRGTFFLACDSCPAQTTAACPIGRVTQSSIFTGANLQTVFPKIVFDADVFAVLSSSSRCTDTIAGHRITGPIRTTATHMDAPLTVSPQRTHSATVSPHVTRRTMARSCCGFAMAAILTFAFRLTVSTVISTGTFQLTRVSVIAWSADTLPGHWVAVLMLTGTLTNFSTIQAICSWNTSLVTSVACESRWTATLPGDVITWGSMGAITKLRAMISI